MPSPTTQSKKKRLLVAAGIFGVPLVILSVVVFMLLHKSTKNATTTKGASAFNPQFPEPVMPKDDKNKLELYMQAQQDSIKRKDERAKDPNINPDTYSSTQPFDPKAPFQQSGVNGAPLNKFTATEDPNEKKVNEHLQKLMSIITPPAGATPQSHLVGPEMPQQPDFSSPQMDKLEKLMALMKDRDTALDPQLQQVSKVLDKIIQIKNPEHSARDSGRTSSPATSLAVSSRPFQSVEGDNDQGPIATPNSFFSLSDEQDTTTAAPASAIRAVVHMDQTVETGANIKLRLLQDIYIGSVRIPANNFIFGKCSVDGDRVDVQLSSAIYNGNIYPIKMRVYDAEDGLEGINVPGTINRDVLKQSAAQSVGGVDIGTLDQSIGAQAAQATIEAVKTLASKKIRLVKVTLKEGHQVILKSPETLR